VFGLDVYKIGTYIEKQYGLDVTEIGLHQNFGLKKTVLKNIREAMVLIKGASLYIGVDNVLLHVAVSLGTPWHCRKMPIFKKALCFLLLRNTHLGTLSSAFSVAKPCVFPNLPILRQRHHLLVFLVMLIQNGVYFTQLMVRLSNSPVSIGIVIIWPLIQQQGHHVY
jgi:hypothetical protein